MVDSKLLEILVCPDSKQPVSLASDELVTNLNQAISSGSLTNKLGNKIEEAIDGALITEDKKICYPIRSDIPVMLIDESIALDQVAVE